MAGSTVAGRVLARLRPRLLGAAGLIVGGIGMGVAASVDEPSPWWRGSVSPWSGSSADDLEVAERVGEQAAVRRRFNEARWTSWNLLRVVTSTVAFGVLAWALVLYGRSS
jgi:hypothetical protein